MLSGFRASRARRTDRVRQSTEDLPDLQRIGGARPRFVRICLSRKEAARIAPASSSISLDRPAIRELEPAAVRRSSGVTLIDMIDQICPHGECGPVKHGEIMYSDENHLTATFSRSLADVLGERLGPIVRARPLRVR